jgi:hypothetical protein
VTGIQNRRKIGFWCVRGGSKSLESKQQKKVGLIRGAEDTVRGGERASVHCARKLLFMHCDGGIVNLCSFDYRTGLAVMR